MNATLTDRDMGFEAVFKQLRELGGNPSVYVGVRGQAAQEKPEGSDATVVEYAAFNEFGTKNVPQRSFLRSTADENQRKYGDLLAKAVVETVDGKPLRQAFGKVGEVAVGDVQQKIRNLATPPNAPSTIKKKGSSNPLIDSGRLRQSIDWEVHNRGKVVAEGGP